MPLYTVGLKLVRLTLDDMEEAAAIVLLNYDHEHSVKFKNDMSTISAGTPEHERSEYFGFKLENKLIAFAGCKPLCASTLYVLIIHRLGDFLYNQKTRIPIFLLQRSL